VAVLYVTISMAAGGRFLITAAGISVIAAAIIPDRVTGQGGDCLVGPAVETGMMNKGKTETA